MNEEEAQDMLKEWKTLHKLSAKQNISLDHEDIEQVIILLRSYLMTFEKGYPFD